MAEPRDIRVTIIADTSKFEREMKKVGKAATAMAESLARTMQQVRESMKVSSQRMSVMLYSIETFGYTANQVEALYYTRGAMDSRYETPAQRDAYLRVLLKAGLHSDVAVAGFLRGWVEHRGKNLEVHPLAWHRYIAGVRVEVGVA